MILYQILKGVPKKMHNVYFMDSLSKIVCIPHFIYDRQKKFKDTMQKDQNEII